MPGYSRGTPLGEEKEVAVWRMVRARDCISDLHTPSFDQCLPHSLSQCGLSNTWPIFSLTCIALGLQEASQTRGSTSPPQPFLHQVSVTFHSRLSPSLHFAWEQHLSRCSNAELVSTFFPEASLQIDAYPSQQKGTLLNAVINRQHNNKCCKH